MIEYCKATATLPNGWVVPCILTRGHAVGHVVGAPSCVETKEPLVWSEPPGGACRADEEPEP